MASIVGTLPISQTVDPNGSLSLDITLQIPPAKMAPSFSLAYHSASSSVSTVGMGWALRGASAIERVGATKDQDGFRGVVNYDKNDRFQLDGQRLILVGENEYRFEIDQRSKIIANGDPVNPSSWTEYLPDGGKRLFGTTADSNVKAVGQNFTRVWAVAEHSDAFSNHVSFSYTNETTNGSFYLAQASYGGNEKLGMAHQRHLKFEYGVRPDISTNYIGGSQVRIDKRLTSLSCFINTDFLYKHVVEYDTAPLTSKSRVKTLTLVDDSNASVRPLHFDWVDGSPSVFNAASPESAIKCEGSDINMIPMDVNASGQSDIVVVSRVTDPSGTPKTRIATHIADATGKVAPEPAHVNEDLPYHVALFPLDVSGDGRTDFVHIEHAASTFVITSSITFEPESTGGSFRCGDFQGNGRVGMVYIYQSGSDIGFVQLVSDGKNFQALPALAGPANVLLDDVRIIIGDLDGNGEEDVFLFSPNGEHCEISLLESQNGTLKLQTNAGLKRAGESITWTDTIIVLPYSIDEDGKTSLLVASENTGSGTLALQLLRGDGRTLLPSPSPIDTYISYNGNLATARVSSTSSLDLVNTFDVQSDKTEITVLKFLDGNFGPSYANSTWGDFRGIGRLDLMLNTQNQIEGQFDVSPVDFIAGYTNGMDARIDISYAPLSDRTMYSTDDDVSTAPLAALNGMARNISSIADLSTSAVSNTSHSRSQIIYFPSWVVKHVTSTPYAAKPDVKEQTQYAYRNARFDYEGRGWLGFEKVTKSSEVIGTAEETSYVQNFPFIGQVCGTQTKTKAGEMLETKAYEWSDGGGKSSDIHSVRMASLKEVYYEGGTHAYSANASYQYDDYGNITDLSIVSPEAGTTPLSIISTFENTVTGMWVLGNKTREVVKQDDTVLKDSQFKYSSGTPTPIETKTWVKASEWSTRTIQLDSVGNELVISGPGPARNEFVYDETYSHIISSKTSISSTSPPLIEHSTFSLENGKPLSYTNSNGNTTSFSYDVLGRLQNTYQEDSSDTVTLINKESFTYDSGSFKHTVSTRSSWDKEEWFEFVEYVDGSGSVWKMEKPKPDRSGFICVETQYDGVGRMVAQSREFSSGSSPAFSKYFYDARSRIVQEEIPPPSEGLPPTTIQTRNSFSSGLADMVKISRQKMRYIPNANDPAVNKLVQPFVVVSVNELGQETDTSFDALGRPICIKDPNGVQLALHWDGLLRLIERHLSQSSGSGSKDLNHSLLTYDDEKGETTLTNVLTGSHTITTSDFAQRPVSVTSPDEEKLEYIYDVGGQYSKGRLMSVTSKSSGVSHHYDYDLQGKVTKDELRINEQSFTTSYVWSPLGQLLSITNPDGTTLERAFALDGHSVSDVHLRDTDRSVQAQITLANYQDVFGRPLSCAFGNGISSLAAVHDNGVIASITLSKSNQTVHRQQWSLDAFNNISGYDREIQGNLSGSHTFQYNLSGELTKATSVDPLLPTSEYVYDLSGNISEKNGKVFANDGWQLSNVKKDGATECSFTYSKDGEMLSKLDSSNTVVRSMKYDSQGRLIQLNNSQMVYDFGGRLVKRTQENGDVIIYPSQTYEVEISASGTKTHTSYLGGTSTVHYFHSDHLGSTIAVSDSGGNIVTQYKYDSFGKVSVEGTDIARYKFSGKELIDNELYYFGARFYDADIGRFVTLDKFPVNLDNIGPSTFNMYAFSRNNPINYVDVDGNAPWWHWLVDAVLIVTAVALMFVPVVGPLATIAMGALTGALLGAGMAGLNADIAGKSTKDWAIDMGIGALTGAITGAASAGLNVALPSLSMSTQALKMGKFVGRELVKVAINQVVGKGAEALGKVIDNVAHGRDADYGLKEIIPGMGDGPTDWVGVGEMAASFGVSFIAGKYRGSKTSDSFRPNGGPKNLGAAWMKVKKVFGTKTGLNGYPMEYPLGQNLLKLAPIKDSSSVVLLRYTPQGL
ncbi:hypothetical protein BDP27DRAFT_1334218 [Rhodocollybia butyracea]|uniref:Teneurin-like YD-shell domain-containing protein n=1 Tax=Rhodocollybia butyracea TaxID=206335 RepID=A0A9P5PL75_9AGAR|nr:hypothetical protein BDP27DRAFT_1334218 [Rhodocollybia butyracea]